jgi:integrase/recombinase XerC
MDSGIKTDFFDHLRSERMLSPHTIKAYKNSLEMFSRWHKRDAILDVTGRELQDFIIEMQKIKSKKTVRNYASALRVFFSFAIEKKLIGVDPTSELILPKSQKLLPKILTPSQITKFLNAPFEALRVGRVTRRIAARDSMIFELFYGAGLRISELLKIKMSDIDRQTQTLQISGKGNRERICPFTNAALMAINEYKAQFLSDADVYLMERDNGDVLSAREIQYRMKFYLRFCGLPADLSPHTIRHAYATHLLNGGTGLRSVQELLGHRSLETTQIYTHVDSKHIKNVHRHCHPHG